MSSWVQLLLLALLAACARFGVTELVRNSPINSIENLHQELLTDSVDEEEANSAANGGHRLPRSPDPHPSQGTRCKLRTEVVELTRDMVDTTSANFLLYPTCVEAQRCSGCCNTRDIQCVSNATNTRNLTVWKITYINKIPRFRKAVVSIVDHLDCTCQLTPRPALLKKKPSHRLYRHLQTLGPAPAQEQDGPAQEKTFLI